MNYPEHYHVTWTDPIEHDEIYVNSYVADTLADEMRGDSRFCDSVECWKAYVDAERERRRNG